MNRILTLLVLLLMISTVSATKMSFSDVFVECKSDASWMECGSLLFVPNLHVKAFWTLVMGNIFRVFYITDYISADGLQVFIDNLWGVISGIGVYIIILTLEFLKDYCILGTIFVCWNAMLSCFGRDTTINPITVATWAGIFMIIGTILLLMYDWSSAINMISG